MAASEPPGTVPAIVDTLDLRSGPEINQALLAVLPLVGSWSGFGHGVAPADEAPFRFAQRVDFAHDGRPFLSYSSHAWLLADDGSVLRPAFREHGFLRPGAEPDTLELAMTSAAGIVSVFRGIAGDQRWEFATDAVGFTPTAKQMSGERRLYALVDGAIGYVSELAIKPGVFRPHLQAELSRD